MRSLEWIVGCNFFVGRALEIIVGSNVIFLFLSEFYLLTLIECSLRIKMSDFLFPAADVVGVPATLPIASKSVGLIGF